MFLIISLVAADGNSVIISDGVCCLATVSFFVLLAFKWFLTCIVAIVRVSECALLSYE